MTSSTLSPDAAPRRSGSRRRARTPPPPPPRPALPRACPPRAGYRGATPDGCLAEEEDARLPAAREADRRPVLVDGAPSLSTKLTGAPSLSTGAPSLSTKLTGAPSLSTGAPSLSTKLTGDLVRRRALRDARPIPLLRGVRVSTSPMRVSLRRLGVCIVMNPS
eukprot:gene9459-biopygen2092